MADQQNREMAYFSFMSSSTDTSNSIPGALPPKAFPRENDLAGGKIWHARYQAPQDQQFRLSRCRMVQLQDCRV